jgi:hypothetical protein
MCSILMMWSTIYSGDGADTITVTRGGAFIDGDWATCLTTGNVRSDLPATGLTRDH